MKTRSNMPLFVLEVSDVKALSNSQIDLLRCGDWLVKKDASGEHPYQVTFKKEGVGMCLTYHDASVIETQSYDWNNSLKKWVYNSEDKTPNLLDAQTEDDVIALLGSGDVPSVKADEIIENMEGYSFAYQANAGYTLENVYVGAVKNGNKLTLVFAFNLTRTSDDVSGNVVVGTMTIPTSVGQKLYQTQIGSYYYLDNKNLPFWSAGWANNYKIAYLAKINNTTITLNIDSAIASITKDTKYYARYEATFLLSDDISQ